MNRKGITFPNIPKWKWKDKIAGEILGTILTGHYTGLYSRSSKVYGRCQEDISLVAERSRVLKPCLFWDAFILNRVKYNPTYCFETPLLLSGQTVCWSSYRSKYINIKPDLRLPRIPLESHWCFEWHEPFKHTLVCTFFCPCKHTPGNLNNSIQ